MPKPRLSIRSEVTIMDSVFRSKDDASEHGNKAAPPVMIGSGETRSKPSSKLPKDCKDLENRSADKTNYPQTLRPLPY